MNNIIDRNSPAPLYQQVKSWLERSIRSGIFRPGSRLPSENEFSQQCGIHRNTVRNALFRLEQEGVLCSVPGSGWFVSGGTEFPRRVAILALRDIDKKKSNPRSEFLPRVTEGLHTGAALYGFEIVRLTADESARLLQGELCDCPLDALIVNNFQSKYLEQLRLLKSKLPLVVFNRQVFGEDIPCVCVDQYCGPRDLLTRLIQNGHRRIGCITMALEPNWRYALERYRGYVDAFAEAGLATEKKLLCQIRDFKQSRRRIRDFLKNNTDMTALFIAGEIFHKSTLELLQKQGRRIPEDISVVAFDRVSGELGKQIISLDQPLEEMGKRVFRVLNDVFAGKTVTGEILLTNITQGSSIRRLD